MTMILSRKLFTIPEGHYTGPKDVDEVPGWVETVGKTSLAGSVLGAITGGVLSSDLTKGTKFHNDNSSILEGAYDTSKKGGLYGAIAGIGLKIFLNYLHNPMNSVKYQEVDKAIRRQFGVYQIAGVPVGDTISKNAKIEEKFSFNDRNVTDYKVNIAIHSDTVTMYTFGMTRDELDKTSKTLDYYCRKYYGVDYSAKLINQKMNSYSVDITFNNYQTVSEFLMELSKTLCTKINLLDSNALVNIKIHEAVENDDDSEEENTRNFSFVSGGENLLIDVGKIFEKKIVDFQNESIIKKFLTKNKRKGAVSSLICHLICRSLERKGKDYLTTIPGLKLSRQDFRNIYLEDTLKKLHYIEGKDYTVGDKTNPVNFSMNSGIFIVVCQRGVKEQKTIDKFCRETGDITRTESPEVCIYSHMIRSRREFEYFLKRFMALHIKPEFYNNIQL